jgi:hypothetical protein
MLAFDKTFKIYLFKDKDTVDLTIRIADNYAHTYTMTRPELEALLENWDTPGGYSFKLGNGTGFIQHKTATPRPTSAPADYVRISIWAGVQHQYRVDSIDIAELKNDFEYQCNNTMFWDNY